MDEEGCSPSIPQEPLDEAAAHSSSGSSTPLASPPDAKTESWLKTQMGAFHRLFGAIGCSSDVSKQADGGEDGEKRQGTSGSRPEEASGDPHDSGEQSDTTIDPLHSPPAFEDGEFVGPFENDTPVREPSAEGTLRLRVRCLSAMRAAVEGAPAIVGGVSRLMAEPREERAGGQRMLGVFLHCCPDSFNDSWTCETTAEFRLVAQRADGADVCRRTRLSFAHKKRYWGYATLVSWADLWDEAKGHSRDGVFEVEVRLKVESAQNILSRRAFRKKVEDYVRLAELQAERRLLDKALECNRRALEFCGQRDRRSLQLVRLQHEQLAARKLQQSIERIESGSPSTANAMELKAALGRPNARGKKAAATGKKAIDRAAPKAKGKSSAPPRNERPPPQAENGRVDLEEVAASVVECCKEMTIDQLKALAKCLKGVENNNEEDSAPEQHPPAASSPSSAVGHSHTLTMDGKEYQWTGEVVRKLPPGARVLERLVPEVEGSAHRTLVPQTEMPAALPEASPPPPSLQSAIEWVEAVQAAALDRDAPPAETKIERLERSMAARFVQLDVLRRLDGGDGRAICCAPLFEENDGEILERLATQLFASNIRVVRALWRTIARVQSGLRALLEAPHVVERPALLQTAVERGLLDGETVEPPAEPPVALTDRQILAGIFADGPALSARLSAMLDRLRRLAADAERWKRAVRAVLQRAEGGEQEAGRLKREVDELRRALRKLTDERKRLAAQEKAAEKKRAAAERERDRERAAREAAERKRAAVQRDEERVRAELAAAHHDHERATALRSRRLEAAGEEKRRVAADVAAQRSAVRELERQLADARAAVQRAEAAEKEDERQRKKWAERARTAEIALVRQRVDAAVGELEAVRRKADERIARLQREAAGGNPQLIDRLSALEAVRRQVDERIAETRAVGRRTVRRLEAGAEVVDLAALSLPTPPELPAERPAEAAVEQKWPQIPAFVPGGEMPRRWADCSPIVEQNGWKAPVHTTRPIGAPALDDLRHLWDDRQPRPPPSSVREVWGDEDTRWFGDS
ncbi:MATH domain-containing protein [Aphelenchoides fujianensis]|nr:MATH domain-containing protein [Aphelenchoides fujianensis]